MLLCMCTRTCVDIHLHFVGDIRKSLGRQMKKRIRKMRRRQEVVAETASFVIRCRRSDAMSSPRALLEAPSTALLSSLFSIRRPYCKEKTHEGSCQSDGGRNVCIRF